MINALRSRLHPLIDPVFRTYWRFSRGLTLGVRTLAADEMGRIMLVRHTYRPGWYLPGGGVERGETAETAAMRELAEEAGLQATAPLELIGFYSNHHAHRGDHVAFYRVPAFAPCAADSAYEIAERGFFDRGALPDGVTAGTKRRLAELYDGAPKAAEW
jgi:ADP-ribose pyrophosphatase YjhB (NUDIX family)